MDEPGKLSPEAQADYDEMVRILAERKKIVKRRNELRSRYTPPPRSHITIFNVHDRDKARIEESLARDAIAAADDAAAYRALSEEERMELDEADARMGPLYDSFLAIKNRYGLSKRKDPLNEEEKEHFLRELWEAMRRAANRQLL